MLRNQSTKLRMSTLPNQCCYFTLQNGMLIILSLYSVKTDQEQENGACKSIHTLLVTAKSRLTQCWQCLKYPPPTLTPTEWPRTPLVNCLLQLRRDPAWSTPFLVDVLCRPNQRCISGTLLRNSSVAIFSTHCNRSDINSVYLKAICYLALGPFSKSRSVNSEYLISRGKVAVVVRLRWGTVYQ